MFPGVLIFAIVAATGAAGTTFVGTESLLLAIAAYAGTGMAVLASLLLAELLTAENAPKEEQSNLVGSKSHG